MKIKSKGMKLDFTQTAAAVVSQSIGEIVHLKSGSPDLKVIRTEGLIEVEWRNTEGNLERAVFARTSLQYPEISN
jgi:uncharacterized protein YodC (DUF2158 family)